LGYKFPGLLVDSDDEINGGDWDDCFDHLTGDSDDSLQDGSEDFFDSEGQSPKRVKRSGDSESSFDSSKLFDGYKDFIFHQQKL
jgi:hypothetical protein